MRGSCRRSRAPAEASRRPPKPRRTDRPRQRSARSRRRWGRGASRRSRRAAVRTWSCSWRRRVATERLPSDRRRRRAPGPGARSSARRSRPRSRRRRTPLRTIPPSGTQRDRRSRARPASVGRRRARRTNLAVIAQFTLLGSLYLTPHGSTLTALRKRTPGAAFSVENNRRASDRRSGPRSRLQKWRPRKYPVSTKRTSWPARAARSMICCRFVGSSTLQSCGERQMIEKALAIGRASTQAASRSEPSSCPDRAAYEILAKIDVHCLASVWGSDGFR